MVRIVVDSRVRLPADLPEEVVAALKVEFTHKNPQWAKLRSMGYAAHEEKPFIHTWAMVGEHLTCPRGGMGRVRDVLRKHGLSWSVDDQRVSPAPVKFPPHRVKLWDHQEEAVEQMLRRENCLSRAPTGSGKTTSAIAFIARAKLPALVVVWNEGLLKQWVERIGKELGLTPADIGVIQGARNQIRRVSVAMQQTLARMPIDRLRIVQKSFGVVVCDEVQRFAARTFMSVVDKMPARYRVGISADQTRKDRKEFLIYDMFGNVASEVSERELVAKGLIHGIEVRVVPTEFRASWYARSSDRSPDFNRLLEAVTTDPDRNLLAATLVESEARAGEQVLVFSHRVEHCKQLDSEFISRGIRSGLMLGGVDWSDVFADTVAQIRSGTKRVGVGTVQAIGQGLDLPSVSRGVVTTHLASNRQLWGQVRGRICRTSAGKTDAIVYYLWDQHVFGTSTVESLARWNERVTVLVDNEWVDAKVFLAQKRKEKKENRDDEGAQGTDWIFE